MAIESQKDVELLKKRLTELARKSYERNMYVYTDFLGLAEQSILYGMERELQYAGVELRGSIELGANGDTDTTDMAERKIVRFGTEEQCGYEEPFPIVCLKISPLQKKFADELTHRDFLGSIMNLGMDRSKFGDLFVKDKEALVFCLESAADYLLEELRRVKHTDVTCKVANKEEVAAITQVKPEEKVLQVSSERIDACIAKLYNMSRNDSLDLFRQGKVYVGGRLCENNSYMLKKDDAVTVRGYGKFIFSGITGETRKGKLCVTVAVFGTRV